MCSPRCFEYWSRLLALAAASASAAPSVQTSDLLDATLSFDLHSHPGLFKSTSNDTLAGHRQSAEAGRVKLIALTATSDSPVIAPDRSGALRVTREAKPGELYASMYRQIDALVKWSGAAGMPVVTSAAEAGAQGAPVRGILAVEGCDFLEGRVDRVQEAYDRGLRSLQ